MISDCLHRAEDLYVLLAALESHLLRKDDHDGIGQLHLLRSSFQGLQLTILYLQTVHSRRRTTFLVVLAFLWKTGLVCPPYPVDDARQLHSKHSRYNPRRTGLLSVVTTLSLSEERSLSGLVLGDLVGGVLAARLSLAVRPTGLGHVNHL